MEALQTLSACTHCVCFDIEESLSFVLFLILLPFFFALLSLKHDMLPVAQDCLTKEDKSASNTKNKKSLRHKFPVTLIGYCNNDRNTN